MVVTITPRKRRAHNHRHKLPNALPRRALPSGAIFNKPPFILFSKTDFFLVTPSRGLPLCPSPVFAPNTHHIIAQKPNSPAFSSTFLVFGTGETRVGDLTGVFFATPPLAATALVFGVLFPGVTNFLDGGVFFAPGVLGFAAGPLLGVALVEARVGVGAAGAATTTAAVVFVGVFDFTGVFVADGVFAGDFAPPALPRNLSLKSLFDRFPSFSLNSLSARILAQAPGRCEARRGKLMSVFANARVSQVSKLLEIFQDTIQDWRRGHGRYGPRQAVRTGAVLRDARGERGGLHLGPRG